MFGVWVSGLSDLLLYSGRQCVLFSWNDTGLSQCCSLPNSMTVNCQEPSFLSSGF